MRTITAKFNSKCAATGQPIKKGETIVYDPVLKRAYKKGNEPLDEHQQAGAMAQAEQEAYFDHFCQMNNI